MDAYNPIAADADNPKHRLSPLVERWKAAINAAKSHRAKEFDKVADEARNFFDGPTNYMWDQMSTMAKESTDQGFLSGESLLPQFKFSNNRMFDAVAMFGPALYHQNPTVAVTSRQALSCSIDTFYAHDPQASQLLQMIPDMQTGVVADPQLMEMAFALQDQYENTVRETERRTIINNDHAVILQALSNYYQNEGNKQDEARLAITEAIVTGLGLLETVEINSPGGGPKFPTCQFISNKDFLVDPDACYWRDVTWIAIRRVSPVNKVEDKFNLPPGSLKGKFVSNTAMAGESSGTTKRNGDGSISGKSHDMIEYYDVFSKNGAGQRLKINQGQRRMEGLDGLGDFVHLAICTSCPFPLNLPANIQLTDPMTGSVSPQVLEQTAWPAPYWDDVTTDGGWPVMRLTFYNNPGKVWPISMCKPCLPEMKFINWCMSFLADGVAAGSKIYPAVLKSAAEDIRSQLAAGTGPFTLIELESIHGAKSINDLVSFLQAPSFNFDIWKMVEQVSGEIDKRLGLTELMYGMSSRQMRSAAEAQYRQSNINIRPDDMASRVEDWLSVSATREIQLLRWNGTHEDVEPIVGPIGAHVFATQILTRDVSSITREFTFRVEAGTARKPNKDTRISQLNDIAQYLLPAAQQAMQMGISKPFNAFIEDYARAMDLDASRYILDENEQMQLQQMMMAQAGMLQPGDETQTNDTNKES